MGGKIDRMDDAILFQRNLPKVTSCKSSNIVELFWLDKHTILPWGLFQICPNVIFKVKLRVDIKDTI